MLNGIQLPNIPFKRGPGHFENSPPPGWTPTGIGQVRNDATGEVMSVQDFNNMVDAQGTATPSTPKQQQNVSTGLNADGSPKQLERESLLDKATGLLKEPYQFKGTKIDPNSLEGYSKVKEEALRKGPSEWLNLAKQRQQVEQSQALDQADRNALSGNAQARSSLAMRGGLSAGARERLGSQMQKDISSSRQNVAGQGILARASLDLQDETNRQGMLGKFAEAEGRLGMYNNDIGNKGQEFNILQSLQEKGRGDDFATRQYEEQMKKWASERQAQATERSGGGGGK
jgi:hypothetical protein